MTEVSIIIPTYNAGRYIARSIASCTSQSAQDVEVLVVDDGSSDGTALAVAEFAERDPRIRFIPSNANYGPSAARNRGLAAARGRWIALLDADDWYDRERLKILIEHGDATSADIVSDNLWLFDDVTGRLLEPMFGGEDAVPAIITPEAFVAGNLPDYKRPRSGLGFMKPVFRTSFLASSGIKYADEMQFAEDYDFYLKALLNGGRWHFLDRPMYYYAIRPSSLTAKHSMSDLARLCQVDEIALRESAVQRSPQLRRLLRQHLSSSQQRFYWVKFIASVKERNYRECGKALTHSFPVFRHIVASCAKEAITRLRGLRTPV